MNPLPPNHFNQQENYYERKIKKRRKIDEEESIEDLVEKNIKANDSNMYDFFSTCKEEKKSNESSFFCSANLLEKSSSENSNISELAQKLFPLEVDRKRIFVQALKKHFKIQNVKGDGHCLVRSILKAEGKDDTEENIFAIRKQLSQLLEEQIRNDEGIRYCFLSEGNLIKLDENIDNEVLQNIIKEELRKIEKENVWLGNESLPFLAEIVKRPIYVYDHSDKKLLKNLQLAEKPPEPVDLKCFGKSEFKAEPIYLYYEEGVHYQLLTPIQS